MNQQPEEKKKPDSGSFDLEIEAEPDTDEIMREALEAVEAVGSVRRDDDEPSSVDASDAASSDKPNLTTDEEVKTQAVDVPGVGAGDDSGQESDSQGGVSALEIELKEAKERTVRALADYENFRRRVDRERVDYARYAAEGALSEFLPVLDDLSRALEADGDAQDLKQGVEMIQRQMVEVLGRLKVNPVASVGERFDPAVHEAVARHEDDQYQHATVIEEYQTGYLLHDRLLRPAMVRVAVPSDNAEASDQASDEKDPDRETDS